MKSFDNINLKKAKKGYEEITADTEFKEGVIKSLKKEKRISPVKRLAFSAVAAAAVFVTVFNAIPPLSYAAADIPILGQFVRVVTLNRFTYKDGGYEANVVTPKIEGLLDKELEDKLNKEFKKNAEAVISAYEQDVKALKEEYGDDTIHIGIDSDYIVKTDNDDILALDVYILNIAGSSSTRHSFYTINKKTGELLSLKGLFKDNADYITPISEYLKDEMLRMNAEEEGMFFIGRQAEGFEGFTEIKPDQNFYIDDQSSLVICFDKYEVAAGAQGCPEFKIPNEIIKDILK